MSTGEGEFNWRFVYSNISVTKGVPLDAHLTLSVFEHFAFARPNFMCETLIDFKNYCKKVAQTADMISIEAELPLRNAELKRQLKIDKMSGAATEVDLDDED